ncbi:hypothetical protein ASG25_10810 [Rhizobium sp. Leaf384]|uniref:hypothetical protein n=1 Tax=Rhizobium sp. Leaf384 TaxID=1736358 RepID=UPI000713A7E0|nr:hypothetical protein [Rhizobium sp. Leaf384]KQS79068.1 hypothetical protein ASG25_10810 [Rhizobium sp. Leaf384]
MALKEVTKFLVMPPAGTDEIDGRFKKHLRDEFPGCEFEVAQIPPLASEEFQVLPVMGKVSGKDAAMYEKPEKWFLDDIVSVCRRFEVSKDKRKAS